MGGSMILQFLKVKFKPKKCIKIQNVYVSSDLLMKAWYNNRYSSLITRQFINLFQAIFSPLNSPLRNFDLSVAKLNLLPKIVRPSDPGGVRLHPIPRFWEISYTSLFQSGEAGYTHLITTHPLPPYFQTFLRP